MVTGRRVGNLGAQLNARDHEIISGVSAKLGGTDEGQDPHELLESALASCTIITMQMYANRKQWDLRSSEVVVQITSEKPEGTEMTREIKLDGDLTSEQRQRILEIADKCPIHRLLVGTVKIETRLVEM
jgi:putative redox protein